MKESHEDLLSRGRSLPTVGRKFRRQVRELLAELLNTNTHFIRCIKPNDEKAPGSFNSALVQHQLRCNGVLESIQIIQEVNNQANPIADRALGIS